MSGFKLTKVSENAFRYHELDKNGKVQSGSEYNQTIVLFGENNFKFNNPDGPHPNANLIKKSIFS